MKKELLFVILLLQPITYAFNATYVQEPIAFLQGLRDGILSFLTQTLGYWVLISFAVTGAVIILTVLSHAG